MLSAQRVFVNRHTMGLVLRATEVGTRSSGSLRVPQGPVPCILCDASCAHLSVRERFLPHVPNDESSTVYPRTPQAVGMGIVAATPCMEKRMSAHDIRSSPSGHKLVGASRPGRRRQFIGGQTPPTKWISETALLQWCSFMEFVRSPVTYSLARQQ